MTATITVAMATYNGGRHIREQLDSLAAQTRLPAELVVCDDQSGDDTVAIVRDFARSAPFPVRVEVNPERLGWRGNFLKAAGLATSDLIAFCDQDDVWYPHKLAILAPHLDGTDVLLASHNADLVDGSGTAYGTLLPVEETVQVTAPLTRPTHWSNPLGLTQLFRRELLQFNDLWSRTADLTAPQHPAAHDQWFFQLATNLGTVVAVPDRLLAYRQHGGNTVGWAPPPKTWRTALRTMGATADAIARTRLMLERFVAVLEIAAGRTEGPMRERLTRAAAENRALLARLNGRGQVYDSTGLVRRAGVLAGMVRDGAYSRRIGWTLGYRALAADLTVGLLYGPSLGRRFGPSS